MDRLDLVFFDAGGGHRSAATALGQALGFADGSWGVGW